MLIDEHGKQIHKFDSASIQHRKLGNRDLNTEPLSLPDDYSGLDAPELYLTDGNETHRVTVNNRLLQLA